MNYIKYGRISLIFGMLLSFVVMTSCGSAETTTVLPDGKLDKCFHGGEETTDMRQL